jgi:hypothetical protein
MKNPDGTLTAEAIALLNKAAGIEPLEMYPLSQLAADLGRANLVNVVGASRLSKPFYFIIVVTEAGWVHVTDPDARIRHKRQLALRRLRG